MHVGIAGEVRCVVTKADGTVKADTGFQKNLILNQGLDVLGHNNGGTMFSKCAIGSGNSNPIATQTQLDSLITSVSGTSNSSEYDYVVNNDNLYKTNVVYKYRFADLGDVNISEVGLISSQNELGTRALIKDSQGAPTTISLKTGETLDIYYKLWQVFNVLDANYTINLLDGSGGSTPYNVICRIAKVTDRLSYSTAGQVLSGVSDRWNTVNTGDITDIKSSPSGSGSNYYLNGLEPYVKGSYKRIHKRVLGLNDENRAIRSLTLSTTMGTYQIRYGSVLDDSPIPKTNKDTLTMPFEFSWGRFEGEL